MPDSLEITFTCARCGDPLEVEPDIAGPGLQVSVSPCQHCLNEEVLNDRKERNQDAYDRAHDGR